MPPALRAAASLAIGSGLSGLALFLLGAAGLLRPAVPAALMAVWGIAGALALHRMHGWRWSLSFARLFRPRRPSPWTLFTGLLFGFLALIMLAGLMLPVMEFDSTMYHMRAARQYRETARWLSTTTSATTPTRTSPYCSTCGSGRFSGEDGLAKLANLEFLLMLVLVLVYAAPRVAVARGMDAVACSW